MGAAVSSHSLNVTGASPTHKVSQTVTILITVPLPLLTRTLLGAAVPVTLGRGAVFRTGADSVISTPGGFSALVIFTAASLSPNTGTFY